MSKRSTVTVQGVAAPVIAGRVNSRTGAEYEYSSISAFAELELGNVNRRRTVSRLLNAGGGVVDGWNVRYA